LGGRDRFLKKIEGLAEISGQRAILP
jgi:hypothetical protein